jgi:hypothetical protein
VYIYYPTTDVEFREPTRGIINTTIAIPRSMYLTLHQFESSFSIGIMHILDSFTEGLSNTPTLYGSSVRQPGQMKDFKSGMKEGGKVRRSSGK